MSESEADGARAAEEAVVRGEFGGALSERARDFALISDSHQHKLHAFESDDKYRKLWRTVIARAATVGTLIGLAAVAVALFEWSRGSALLPSETLSGAHPTSLPTVVLMLLLGMGILVLIRSPVSPWRRRLADLLAVVVVLLSVVGVASLFAFGDPGAWGETGRWRGPSVAIYLLAILFAVGLLAVDRTRNGTRFDGRITLAIGIVVEVGFLSRGYRIPAITGTVALNPSLIGLFGNTALLVGYLGLRPDRGLAGFMGSTGAGPAMARLLAPVVVAVPFALTVGRELPGFRPSGTSEVIWLVDEILVVTALLLVVVYASRRLQAQYEDWRSTADELSERAGVLTAMADGVALLRLKDERIVLTNPQFDRMHGYPSGFLVGRSIHITRPADASAEEVADWKQIGRDLIEHGRARYESRALRRDGSVIWCRSNAILAEDPRYGPVMIIVKTDISAERRLKHARQAAEGRFRQVFELSPIGLALLRPDGSFERVNKTFMEMTGYSAKELERMVFKDVTHPDDLAEDLRLTGAMFRGETDGFRVEKRYIRKDGSVAWVDLSAVVLRNEDGRQPVALAMIQDVTERYEMSRRLRYLADHDPLTGLLNRRRFKRELEQATSDHPGGGLAVMVVDLDHFKFVNDVYGHGVGDRLIVKVGEVIGECLRSGDLVARQGGDEFVILLRDIRAGDAVKIAETLAGEIASKARVEGPGFLTRASASIGVAADRHPEPGASDRLIREADIAMYEVKDSGRNGARLFEPGPNTEMRRGVDWYGRIRQAIDRSEFILYAQPLFNMRGDPAPRFELLLRLPGPDGKISTPGAFLPIAERHNLIREIDRWVVQHAIQLLRACGPGLAPCLFVNLSGQSVGDMSLISLIETELERAGVGSDRLVFEFTETSAISNLESVWEFNAALTRIGCRTALDDFGAGFASFYYLKHISTDFVKIDGEFVRSLVDDPASRLLVQAFIDLSQGLGRQAVAEHVEDEQTLQLLESFGIDLVQGYLFGKPQPATIEMLEQQPLNPATRY